MRRAQHDKMTLPQTQLCDNCGEDVLSHRVCPRCGWYRGAVRIEHAVPVEELPAQE
jgi:large subunit ribosomal protein L32